jgi:hypothetical protein
MTDQPATVSLRKLADEYDEAADAQEIHSGRRSRDVSL